VRLERALRHAQRQHVELAELERELQQAIDRHESNEIDTWFARYSSGLVAHFVLEEDVLFPILLQMGEDMRTGVRELMVQHRRLRDDLAKLEATSNAYDVAAGLAALRVQVAAHESLEEGLATDALARAETHPDGPPPRRSPA
jgi:iron-sulfur cluster repair protein YtfE (RIC family)